MILTTTHGQTGLPRYFSNVFDALKTMKRGRIDIILPDGRHFRADGAEPGYVAEVHVHNTDVFARTVREGDLGFCESYMDGWWSTPDLMAFMDLMHDDMEHIYDGFPGQFLVRFYERMRFWLQNNSKKQARKNISYHYDLGNEFYGLWLDDTMTYSSAKFVTGQESMEAGQIEKYKSMVDQMGVQPGDHVLEIGCGWGGFAEYAAKERGLRVTGLTISQAQHDYAVARMQKAGLSDKVTIKMQDYRDEKGIYDGIASIEMFEAVGENTGRSISKPCTTGSSPARMRPCRSSPSNTGAGMSTNAASISSRNTSFRVACCPAPSCCAKRLKKQGCTLRNPSNLAKAIARPCAAGTIRSTRAGIRCRRWGSMTGSGGCGTFI
jgi:Cyclopropane fatty acid synthase and related methyltransferases